MLLLYILWDDGLIFMISGSNEQLQQQLEYTLLKPDCHILNFQESTTILNTCSKNVWKLIECTPYVSNVDENL